MHSGILHFFRFILLAALILCNVIAGYTQEVRYPFLFEQLPQSFGNNNPAFESRADPLSLRIGYNGLNALSSNIYTVYATGYATLNRKVQTKSHQPFINVLSDHEGLYIGRNRVYGGYRYIQKLSNNWSLSGGASVGIVSHNIKGNIAVGGTSSSALDGNLGVVLKAKKSKIGISVNQFLNNELELYSTKTELLRHYGVYVQHKEEVTPDFLIELNAYSRLTSKAQNEYIIGVNVYHNELLAGFTYRRGFGLITMLGIERIQWGRNYYGLSFSYRIPIRARIPVDANQFECSLNFVLGDGEGLH